MSDDARRRLWSPEEIDLVLACYEFTPTTELAGMLGRTIASVYNLANKLDLEKDPELVREMARERSEREGHGARLYRFPKGHVPYNKGKRMPGWSAGRMASTQFKAGQQGWNWMPIGAKRKIDGYWYRKVADERKVPYTRNWKAVHILLWEKHRGPVPPAHAVVFRDGDVEHIRLRNLEIISRAELMVRNSIHNLPKPLVEVIMLNGALKRRIRNKEKRHAEEQNVRSA